MSTTEVLGQQQERSGSTSTTTKQFTRSSTNLKPKWDRFFPKSTATTSSSTNPNTSNDNNNTSTTYYNNQYSLMYTSRLEQLRKRIVLPTKSNGNVPYVSRIIGLKDDDSKCIVIGTIVKQCRKTSAKDFDAGLGDGSIVPLATTTYTDPENDLVVLEDESGRIELEFDCCVVDESRVLSTGVVVGIQGSVQSTIGRFKVEKFLYPTLPLPPLTSNADESKSNNRVALISGLQVGLEDENHSESNSLRRALLIDYLCGNMNNTASSSTISRLLIAGGNISTTNKKTPFAIHELDLFFSEICANGIPIEVIPGKYDPTNANFPFRSFHPCLFPNVTQYFPNYIHFSSNPFDADIDSKCFLGTDGSNILNFMHFTNNSTATKTVSSSEEDETHPSLSPIQALEYTLRYNVIAPTAPDTIPSFPFNKADNIDDPLVMQYAPHVYFIGNCMQFQTKKVGDEDDVDDHICRLICIPDFSKTGQIVLLDLDTLDCEVVQIVETLED